MIKHSPIYCFRANYQPSSQIDEGKLPDWLCLGVNWQGYRIWTVPWIADVAQLLGVLEIENSPEGWMFYLEGLGFQGITPVACEDFFEDQLYC